MARVLITGCSYGCGEWQHNSPMQQHRGLAQYLEEAGHTVTNVSRGGSHNAICIERITDIHQDFDCVIFMMTAVSRDLANHYDVSKSVLENVKQRADQIVDAVWELCGSRTIMLGALYKIPSNNYNFIAQFNGIDLLIPDNQWPDCYADSHDFIKLHYRIRGQSEIDLNTFKQQILNCNDDAVWSTMKQHPEWFEPDGKHWNRHAHRIIAAEVLKYIK